MFENRGNDGILTRSGQLQGENRKEYLRITRIFDAEDGCFWVKRRRFRFFKQALIPRGSFSLVGTQSRHSMMTKYNTRFAQKANSAFFRYFFDFVQIKATNVSNFFQRHIPRQ
ncbi:MAG: hypothetical protein HFE95_08220 [Acutalibacter sp.]|nr:hypothetical protein [Acutalibacter sp.]